MRVLPLLVGPAGSGKTTIAKGIAADMGKPFRYTGQVTSAFQLTGFNNANGEYVPTNFVEAYKDGCLFLFDEMDSCDPQAILTVNAALDNNFLATPGGIIEKHPEFVFMATANTWGHGATLDYVGRNPLDGATLDRFVTVPVDYDFELEVDLVSRLVGEKYTGWNAVVAEARMAARELDIKQIISTRAAVFGAKMLRAGMPIAKVFNATVIKGMNKDTAVMLTQKTNDNLERIDLTEIEDDVAHASELLDGDIFNKAKYIVKSMNVLNDNHESIKKLASVFAQLEVDKHKNRYIQAKNTFLQVMKHG